MELFPFYQEHSSRGVRRILLIPMERDVLRSLDGTPSTPNTQHTPNNPINSINSLNSDMLGGPLSLEIVFLVLG